jgi:hypothetical protein
MSWMSWMSWMSSGCPLTAVIVLYNIKKVESGCHHSSVIHLDVGGLYDNYIIRNSTKH